MPEAASGAVSESKPDAKPNPEPDVKPADVSEDVSDADAQDFVYRRLPNMGSRILMHYTGDDPIVKIPADVNSLGEWEGIEMTEDSSPGYPGVFLHPEKIRRIILPEGLHSIGPKAFRGCVNLEELVFPSTLDWLSADFSDCSNLQSVVFNSSVPYGTTVGRFRGCHSLRHVELPAHSDMTRIDPYMFEDCTGLEEIVIPWSVVSIAKGAFKNCTRLRKVILPAHAIIIHPEAFEGCLFHPPLEYTKLKKFMVCPLCGGAPNMLGYCKNCDTKLSYRS